MVQRGDKRVQEARRTEIPGNVAGGCTSMSLLPSSLEPENEL
jgi:hypothetical protein